MTASKTSSSSASEEGLAEIVGGDNRLFLVDGSGFLFRAFHALPPMTRSDGTPVNAVYGFTNMLIRLVEDWNAPYVAVVFDPRGGSFRNEIYSAYKANRPPPPEELVPQFPLVREAVRAYNLPCLEMEGFEADDVIATLAQRAAGQGLSVTIVSSDKDLMQLVGENIVMLDPLKNRRIGPAEVQEKFGVAPEKVIDVQALAGDSTDNVPGVPGIGVKTAAQLIDSYGDLESLLDQAEGIKQPKRRQNLVENRELALISKQLVTLRQDVPIEDDPKSLVRKAPDPATMTAFLQANGFKTILTRLRRDWEEAGLALPDLEDGDDDSAALQAPKEIHYSLVQDRADLDVWIAKIWQAGAVAIDTETSALSAMEAALVGISLSVTPGEACYIPLGHGLQDQELSLEEPPKQLPLKAVLTALKEVLESPSVLKILQNAKYDWLVLARQDPAIEIAPLDDSMVLSYILDGAKHGHGMDALAKMHLGHDTIKFSDVAGSGKKQIRFDQVPLAQARDYAAEDADITLRLHSLLKPAVLKASLASVYETLDRPLVTVLARMEQRGIKIDSAELQRMSGEFAENLTQLEKDIHGLAGESFNIASPKQLGEILFDRLGLQGGKKTKKTGVYSTDSAVLEPLAAQGHEIVQKVLDWRQMAKLKSTYVDALVNDINPETGRVHTSFSQTVAATGRLSSNSPNLQNIPIRTEAGKRIREAFIPEAGCKIVSIDYSQIELRLAADMANITSFKEAFQKGEDIHAMTAAHVFGETALKQDPGLRRQAKAINFGIIYGISGYGLAQQLGIETGDANAYIKDYLDRLPEFKDWLEAVKKQARESGAVSTLFGRRIPIQGINDKNWSRRSFAERQAINAPLQGTAADIIKRAMIRMEAALEKAGLRARMLLQVHDELLFEVPEAEVEACIAVAKEVMETATLPVLQLSVPLLAEAGVGTSWAAAH